MSDHDPAKFTRRGFLAATVAAALAACSDGADGDAAPSTTTASTSPPSTAAASTSTTSTTLAPTTTAAAPTSTTVASLVTTEPFGIGVASGDPLHDRVILWTRLVPDAPLPEVDVPVEWEVASDAAMTSVVTSGTAAAVSALGHSVHVDVTGLDADTEYWYRFRVGEFMTEPARTRTFAAPGTMPDQFRFAFSSCQNWEQGYYTAYRDIVEQGDLDAFVFLGDYIYEYASGGYSDPRGRLTGQDFECVTIDQYRARYALYRSDPLLRAAHAHVPWIITWDDHEVDNDYADDISEQDDATGEFLTRRAASYLAWYEHMPVRLDPPAGPDYAIYRSFAHGDLLRFHVLDTRQYRADQQRQPAFVDAIGPAVQQRDEAVAFSPEQTMLGVEQKAWLIDGVAQSSAVWDVLAQQVFMFGGNAIAGSEPPIVVVDTWDGYAGEREELLEALAPTVDNLVVLTGDFHSAAVGQLRSDPFDVERPVIGTEFMASSISSGFFDDSPAIAELVAGALTANSQIQFFDSRHGYTLCEVTPDEWRATFRAVTDAFDENAEVVTASTWRVIAGTPGAVQT